MATLQKLPTGRHSLAGNKFHWWHCSAITTNLPFRTSGAESSGARIRAPWPYQAGRRRPSSALPVAAV